MSSLVYFKFKANVKTDSIPFDGSSISVKDLKAAVRTKCCLYSTDFDLKLEDTSGKAYTKDDELIPKYTSIVVRRVPRITTDGPRRKIPTADELPWKESQRNANATTNQSQKLINLAESDLSEEEKIKIMMERSSEAYSEKHFTVKAKPYGVPPAAYVCHKCSLPGHWIHNCPGVRDQTGKVMDVKSVKRPTGIPQDFLLEVEAGTPGAYLGKSGKYMVPIKDAEAYAQGKKDKRPFSVEENPPYVPYERVPPKQFICPLCSSMFRDAVLVSCCGTTYCNECIMGHVFDSQILGSHTCPNCGAELNDHESSVFENALVRSMIRDWLANEPLLPEPETELTTPSIFSATEEQKCFINNRRVLKPKHSTTSNIEVKQEIETTKPSNDSENKTASYETRLKEATPTTNASCTSPIDSKDIFEPAISVTAVVPSNTCTAVVASAPCTTIVGSGREALLVSSDFSVPTFSRVSYASSAMVPNILPSINSRGNPLLTALYNMRVDGLQPSVATQQVVLPASFQGPLIGGPDWATTAALAVSQSTGLIDTLAQLDNTQGAYGLVTGQALPGTFSTAPIQAIDGQKVLSKEEFYRLKMEVLDSARRRHRHRSRSRSPYRSHHRRNRDEPRLYSRGYRAPRHSQDEFESDYKHRRRHHPVDFYESNRDRSRIYSSRNHLDGDRHVASQDINGRERCSKSNELRTSSQHRKRDGSSRSHSKSRSSERSRERRFREPHAELRGDQPEATRNPERVSPTTHSDPVSIVPQYDVSEPESTESKCLPLRRGNSEEVHQRHVVRTCDASHSDENRSKIDNPLLEDTECTARTGVDHEVPEANLKRLKKEKKHKKHKHRHSEKKKQKKMQRALESLDSDSHVWVLNPLDINPTYEASVSEALVGTEKKHKKHKKHKHGQKEKKKKHAETKNLSVGVSENS